MFLTFSSSSQFFFQRGSRTKPPHSLHTLWHFVASPTVGNDDDVCDDDDDCDDMCCDVDDCGDFEANDLFSITKSTILFGIWVSRQFDQFLKNSVIVGYMRVKIWPSSYHKIESLLLQYRRYFPREKLQNRNLARLSLCRRITALIPQSLRSHCQHLYIWPAHNHKRPGI